MIGTLGHNLGGHDDRPILLLRHCLLGVEDAILKSLAKFLGCGIKPAHQALGQASQDLGQYNACIAPGPQHSCVCHPPCQAANAFVDTIGKRQHCRPHGPEHIGPWHAAVKELAAFLDLVDAVIF